MPCLAGSHGSLFLIVCSASTLTSSCRVFLTLMIMVIDIPLRLRGFHVEHYAFQVFGFDISTLQIPLRSSSPWRHVQRHVLSWPLLKGCAMHQQEITSQRPCCHLTSHGACAQFLRYWSTADVPALSSCPSGGSNFVDSYHEGTHPKPV